MNCSSHPDADERESASASVSARPEARVALPREFSGPKLTPAESGRLDRICAQGAWFCSRCVGRGLRAYWFQNEILPGGVDKCPEGHVLRWQPPIY